MHPNEGENVAKIKSANFVAYVMPFAQVNTSQSKRALAC
jgi:hypothetical protein